MRGRVIAANTFLEDWKMKKAILAVLLLALVA